MENKTAQEILNEVKTSDWDKESFKNKFYVEKSFNWCCELCGSLIKGDCNNNKGFITCLNEGCINQELKRIKERGINNNQKARNTTQTDKDKNLFKNLGVDYYE